MAYAFQVLDDSRVVDNQLVNHAAINLDWQTSCVVDILRFVNIVDRIVNLCMDDVVAKIDDMSEVPAMMLHVT